MCSCKLTDDPFRTELPRQGQGRDRSRGPGSRRRTALGGKYLGRSAAGSDQAGCSLQNQKETYKKAVPTYVVLTPMENHRLWHYMVLQGTVYMHISDQTCPFGTGIPEHWFTRSRNIPWRVRQATCLSLCLHRSPLAKQTSNNRVFMWGVP